MASFEDVRYWECVGILHHDDGSATYRLRVVKDKTGKNMGMEVAVRGRGDALWLNELYDENLTSVPRKDRPPCPYPLCEEPGTNLVRDVDGYIVRACLEHGEEYRIDAHEAGQHAEDMVDPNCDGCWDEVRAGEKERPQRFRTWRPE